MKSKLFCFVLIFLGWVLPSLAQTCPSWSEKPALLKFLQDHKSNSLAADSKCVDRAFSSLSHDRTYTPALIQLLDFERSTKHDYELMDISSKYPAISALATSSAVPSLIAAIKDNENELIRKNAVEALAYPYHQTCPLLVADMLEKEAEKSDVDGEQQDHLRTAAEYINEQYSEWPCRSRKSDE